MALDEPDDDEKTVSVNGIDVLISEMVEPFVSGTVIDYVTQSNGEGFVLKGNPGSC